MLLTVLYIIGITAEAMTGALAAGRGSRGGLGDPPRHQRRVAGPLLFGLLLAILLHASGNTWSEVLHQPPATTTASAAGWSEIGVFAGAALVAVWITRRRASRLQEHRP